MKQINYSGSSKLISRIVSLLNRKAPLPLDGDGDPDWGTNGQVLTTDGSGNTSWTSGGGSGGHIIQDNGTDMTPRAKLDFVGATVTDDAVNDATVVEFSQAQADWNEADNTKADYIKNKPTIPAAQIQSDWSQNDSSAVDFIKNKPSIPTKTSDLTNDSDFVEGSDLATVATSGSYTDLSNTPTIPTVNDGTLTIQQNGTTVGTFSANQSGNTTVNLTGGGSTYTAGDGINISAQNAISVDTAFTEASTRANIASGDTLATIWGKIKKFFTDLKTVAFTGSYNDLTDKPSVPGGENYVLKAGDTMSGCLSITSTGNNFTEGVRINTASDGFFTLLLGGSGNSGTRDGAFWIGGNNTVYPRILFVAHNGSNASTTYFHASSSSDSSPKLHVPSGSIASGDGDAVNGDAVYSYIASGNKDLDSHNANDSIKNGFYYYTSNGPATSLGASTNDGALYTQSYSSSWVAQIAQDYRNGRLFVRGKNNGTWQAWKRIANYDEVVPINGVTTVVASSNDVPLYMQGNANGAYIGYKTSNGTIRGYIGVTSAGKPCFYDSASREIITSATIGSQSVNYATSAGSATNASYATSAGSASSASSASYAGSAGSAKYVFDSFTICQQSGNNARIDTLHGHHLLAQDDKNLVWYSSTNSVIWQSGTSSRRFKHNIQSMTEERARKILQIRAVTFDWNDNLPISTQKCDNAGVIAEEVSQIIPDVVVFEDYDNDPNVRIERRVEYERFTPYLIKMVQMQQKQIDTMQATINALEQRLSKLEGK